MEVIALAIFFWMIFTLIGKRRAVKKAGKVFGRMVDESALKLSEKQAAYEADMASLPEVKGDGTFSVEIDLTDADLESLESLHTYLEVKGLKRQTLATALVAFQSGCQLAVAVELSQAQMGVIHGPFGEKLFAFIDGVGGRARCSGKLIRSSDNEFRLFIDVSPTYAAGTAH